jgi:hypothetical protein
MSKEERQPVLDQQQSCKGYQTMKTAHHASSPDLIDLKTSGNPYDSAQYREAENKDNSILFSESRFAKYKVVWD